MVTQLSSSTQKDIIYPESDGQERQRAQQAEDQLQTLRALLEQRGMNPDNL